MHMNCSPMAGQKKYKILHFYTKLEISKKVAIV